MPEKVRLLAVLLGAFAVACSDTSGPALVSELSLENAQVDGPSFAKKAKGDQGKGDEEGNAAEGSAPTFVWLPALETYEASVWAVPFESRVLHINYLAEGKNGKVHEYPFLKLHIPPGALVQPKDGTPITAADSVLITVSVDSADIKTTMGPSGLQFSDSAPPKLRLWYSGVDGDLDGDGRVTKEDRQIENELLAVLYQSRPGDPWVPVEAEHNPADDWFELRVGHFSGFAVAY